MYTDYVNVKIKFVCFLNMHILTAVPFQHFIENNLDINIDTSDGENILGAHTYIIHILLENTLLENIKPKNLILSFKLSYYNNKNRI